MWSLACLRASASVETLNREKIYNRVFFFTRAGKAELIEERPAWAQGPGMQGELEALHPSAYG